MGMLPVEPPEVDPLLFQRRMSRGEERRHIPPVTRLKRRIPAPFESEPPPKFRIAGLVLADAVGRVVVESHVQTVVPEVLEQLPWIGDENTYSTDIACVFPAPPGDGRTPVHVLVCAEWRFSPNRRHDLLAGFSLESGGFCGNVTSQSRNKRSESRHRRHLRELTSLGSATGRRHHGGRGVELFLHQLLTE